MTAFECPILTATRKGKKVSKNPCQNCGMYDSCIDDLSRDMSEEVLKIAGAFIRAVKESSEEYAKSRKNK